MNCQGGTNMSNTFQMYTTCGNTIKKDPFAHPMGGYSSSFSHQAISKKMKLILDDNGEPDMVEIEPITPNDFGNYGYTEHDGWGGSYIMGDDLYGPRDYWP